MIDRQALIHLNNIFVISSIQGRVVYKMASMWRLLRLHLLMLFNDQGAVLAFTCVRH